MNKYRVIVTRDITESVIVDVYADSEDAAEETALSNIPIEADWEIDDGSWDSGSPYVTDVNKETDND